MSASPSIAPEHTGVVYLVLDDLGGKLGRTWRETDEEDTDRETLICDLLDGQYASPAWIVAFGQLTIIIIMADRLGRFHARPVAVWWWCTSIPTMLTDMPASTWSAVTPSGRAA